MKVYYAHSMSIYGTLQEARDLDTLAKLGFLVLNPNKPKHQKGYTDSKLGMDYFLRLVESCDALVFRSLPFGRIPAGVAMEVDHAIKLGLPVFELPSSITARKLTLDETREHLREVGQR